MVGFDVTPTTQSSDISEASWPLWSISRESESIHTLTPASLSCFSLESAIGHPFELGHLGEPVGVPSPAHEAGTEEGAHELAAELGADDLGAETEDVHVVVLDALVRGVGVVADRGTDPGDLRGRDRGADARAAD